MALNNDISLKVGFDLNRLSAELSRTNSMMASWGNQIRGHLVSAFSIYAVFQGVRQSITTINEFNHSISELKALTGLAGHELEKLRQNALNLAGAFRAIEVVRGQSELSRLGFSPEEIQKSIKAVTLLATATGTDLPRATEIAGSTLRAFNMDASQMQRITDVMASSFNKTALDVTSFGEAMKYVAPNAAAANISLEETVAMLGTLANNGIKGSMAGTALRRIVQDLAGESGTLADKFDALNKKNITASYAFDEVGRIASTAFLILARGAKTTEELTTAFHNVNGETQKMADIMLDNVVGAWKQLHAEWDRVLMDNDGPMTSFMKELTDNMRDQLTVWNSVNVTWWQKFWGDRDDYRVYAENIRKMREEVEKLNAATFDMSDEGGIKPIGFGSGGSGGFRDALRSGAFGGSVIPQAEEAIGLLPFLEAKMKTLKELMDKTWDSAKIVQYATKLKEIKDIIEKITAPIKEAKREGAPVGLLHPSIPSIADMFLPKSEMGPGKDGGSGVRGKDISAALERGKMIGQALLNGFRTAVRGIGEVLAAAFSGGNWQAALLDTIGNIAIQLGGLVIAIGIGVESIKEALLNPFSSGPAAIMAGIALVALGAAAKAGAASIASSNGGSSTGGGGSLPRFADRDMTSGEWRIRGADLVYVLNKQGYRGVVAGG